MHWENWSFSLLLFSRILVRYCTAALLYSTVLVRYPVIPELYWYIGILKVSQDHKMTSLQYSTVLYLYKLYSTVLYCASAQGKGKYSKLPEYTEAPVHIVHDTNEKTRPRTVQYCTVSPNTVIYSCSTSSASSTRRPDTNTVRLNT